MASVVKSANARMIQAGNCFCFAVEALAQLGSVSEMGGENLDGDGSIETRVTGFVHFAHSARTFDSPERIS